MFRQQVQTVFNYVQGPIKILPFDVEGRRKGKEAAVRDFETQALFQAVIEQPIRRIQSRYFLPLIKHQISAEEQTTTSDIAY
jgi:hypothetical protein